MSVFSALQEFWNDPEPLIATVARLFASEGAAREVAILAHSKVVIKQTSYDNWDGGTYGYTVYLNVTASLHQQLALEIEKCEQTIAEKARLVTRGYLNHGIHAVFISPEITAEDGWRDKAKAWVIGEGVSNQGRVRSANVAPKTADGLLFRSEPEIHLYRALKASGVSFAPLPVFVRGGQTYQRIEPDFVIVHNGIVMVVEVDGDTVHHETPAEAHLRIQMLQREGVYVERIRASECNSPELAIICARRLQEVLAKHKQARP